ncbi:hypothetical protein V8F33_003051 [Rhypophila sp. PSN 637]
MIEVKSLDRTGFVLLVTPKRALCWARTRPHQTALTRPQDIMAAGITGRFGQTEGGRLPKQSKDDSTTGSGLQTKRYDAGIDDQRLDVTSHARYWGPLKFLIPLLPCDLWWRSALGIPVEQRSAREKHWKHRVPATRCGKMKGISVRVISRRPGWVATGEAKRRGGDRGRRAVRQGDRDWGSIAGEGWGEAPSKLQGNWWTKHSGGARTNNEEKTRDKIFSFLSWGELDDE